MLDQRRLVAPHAPHRCSPRARVAALSVTGRRGRGLRVLPDRRALGVRQTPSGGGRRRGLRGALGAVVARRRAVLGLAGVDERALRGAGRRGRDVSD